MAGRWQAWLTAFKLPSRHAALKRLADEVNGTLGGDVAATALLLDPASVYPSAYGIGVNGSSSGKEFKASLSKLGSP